MKILLVNNLGIDAAGAEVIVRQLKEGLNSEGHDARLLAGDTPSSPNKFSDFTFRSFGDTSKVRFLLYTCNPFAVWKLARVLKSFKPDVVHLHNVTRLSPFILALLKKVPTVLTIHDHMVFDPTRLEDLPGLRDHKALLKDYFIKTKSIRYIGEKLRFFFARRFDKNIDVAVACSSYYGRAAEGSGLFKNVQVVHNGIQLPGRKDLIKENDVLYVGRIDSSKGVDTLVRAMAEVFVARPDARLRVVGDGDFRPKCEQLAAQLGVSDKIRFLGYRPHAQSLQSMADSTLLVVPSRYPDNFPTVCLEAMSVGRAVVASDIGGTPEMVVDGETGFLFKAGDHRDLAQKILAVLCDPASAYRMGSNGRHRAETEFTADSYTRNMRSIYKAAIANIAKK